MGGAPSRETLVRHIVRDPRMCAGDASSLGDASAATLQQPEIVLIPVIPDYFPSSASPLFQQLVHVRREPTVSYYYRDARSTSMEHTVVRSDIGSDKELYNWYMSLSEQRLVETDNELIALSRAGRVVSPVPCAVAFVYNTNVTPLVASAAAAERASVCSTQAASSHDTVSVNSSAKRKDTSRSKQRRRRKQDSGNFNTGFMTIENTVRVPHHNLRVRVFGFVGDTRFCPPSMQPHQAAKSPMCFTIFLSKTTGGNHRAQVTLLAAYTYMKQLQEIGSLRHVEGGISGPLVAPASSLSNNNSMVRDRATNASFSPVSLAAVAADYMDPLAGLRFGGAGAQAQASDTDPCGYPYTDPYSVEGVIDPYAVEGYEEQRPQQEQPFACPSPHGGTTAPLSGLGSTLPFPAVEMAKEVILRRPVELIVHRADVPSLCYVRELRALMDRDASSILETPAPTPAPAATADQLRNSEGGDEDQTDTSRDARFVNSSKWPPANAKQGKAVTPDADSALAAFREDERYAPRFLDGAISREDGERSLKRLLRTVITEEELRGSVDADSVGRVLLWASRFYATHFEQLVGGEAARLRRELAQQNLNENPLDGTLSLYEEEPRPPTALPVPGDVWITPRDTYVEVRRNAGDSGGIQLLQHEMESWKPVPAGTVLRYVAGTVAAGGVRAQAPSELAPATADAPAIAPAASRGTWQISKNEFAEDILLSLCRNVCHVSRQAPPSDEHWLLNRETDLPEGLPMGLLIWRELVAGQVVYYGTIPDFLKQWMQSNVKVETAYGNHMAKIRANVAMVGGVTSEAEANRKQGEEGLPYSAGDSGSAAATRYPTSIAVDTAYAATTAASKGLHSSHDGKSSAYLSDFSSGSHWGRGNECGKGPGSPTTALYSVRTGFVSTPEEDGHNARSTISAMSLPTGNGPAACAIGQLRGEGSPNDSKWPVMQRVSPETATAAAAVYASAKSAVQVPVPVAGPHSCSGSVGHHDVVQLSQSSPAYQRSPLAIPVSSSKSLVWTSSSATTSTSSAFHSYNKFGCANTLGSLSTSNPHLSAAHATRPHVHPHQQEHTATVKSANACCIDIPDATPSENFRTPTVNVVVRQRRNVRLTSSASLHDSATVLGNSDARFAQAQGSENNHISSYARAQRREDVLSLPYASTWTQPIRVGSLTSGTIASGAGLVGPTTQGSLPIHIFGSQNSSSEESGLRQGGHSPSLQKKGYSLLSGDDALILHASVTRSAPLTCPTTRQSSAMDVRPGQNGSQVGTPMESSSLRWATSFTAQPTSMRGASVSFASGSVRHGSLLQCSGYPVPCQPMMSHSVSLSASELLDASTSSMGSFHPKKEALRAPSLLVDATVVESKRPVEKKPSVAVPAQCPSVKNVVTRANTSGLNVIEDLTFAAPMAAAVSDDPVNDSVFLRNSSGAHTPRQENVSESSRSSIGSGKYRWDWRGAAWSS
ncbi:hypothetical protein ABL78_1416 [Leptomonas seymouri]|uniref:Uncharacterized protein n=1 Tax=Leptomonas seymouri TaxID=5684 RepID=A0A0N1I0N3_LEPSE|nr:hypothetical protein ABL78_1416 [Leptomonas seymouri]|eukprot:KPI89452.1 hypothetical protein ABL78_1416 [Leptomonas seymouri]